MKTVPNTNKVADFIAQVEDEGKRKDALEIIETFENITGEKAVMWGDSIVGFGSYHYNYASGREGDWMQVGFSPRKQNLTLYFMPSLDAHAEDLKKLGKHKTGKSCLYIKKLSDIDMKVLKGMVKKSMKLTKNLYG